MKRIVLIILMTVILLNGQSYDFRASSLYADIKAHEVGDIITVLIVESSNASRESNIKSDTKTGMDLQGTISGTLTEFLPLFGAQSNLQSEMDSKEQTGQKDRFTGKISATITEVDESGTLLIKGERILQVNGEKNVIRLSGKIRTRDIMNDNTIYSYNIADAEILYRKGGGLENALKPRMFQNLLTWTIGFGLIGLAFIGGLGA